MRRNFFRRRRRDTQPKNRVPRTRFLRFLRSTILFSEELEVPSRKRCVLRARVIRARWISPTFTFRRSRRRLTETRIRSPGCETVRWPPPRVFMHSTDRAPELSLVLSHVCT